MQGKQNFKCLFRHFDKFDPNKWSPGRDSDWRNGNMLTGFCNNNLYNNPSHSRILIGSCLWSIIDSLLRIATNEIASFWKDQRSRQWLFFVQRRGKGGAKGRLSRYVEIFWNKKGFSLLYKTNRFHVAVRLFCNRSEMTSKCGKNKNVAHEA